MTRMIVVLCLLAGLITFAIVEQVCIDRVYSKMMDETTAIIEVVQSTQFDSDNQGTFDDYTKARVDELHNYWIKRERRLGILIRHVDLSYVSDALIYAQNFIHFDNQEEAMAGLRRLEYLLDSYSGIYGLNGINIL